MVKTQHISGGGTEFPSENMYIEEGIAWEGLWDVILGQPPRRKFSLYTPRIIFSIKPSSFQFSIFFLVSPTNFHIQSVGFVGRFVGLSGLSGLGWFVGRLFVGSSISFNFFKFILLLLLFFSLSKVFYPFHISQNFPFSSTPVSPLSTYIWLINICLSGFSFQGGRTLPFLLEIFLSLFSSFSLVHLLILFGHLLTLHGHGH